MKGTDSKNRIDDIRYFVCGHCNSSSMFVINKGKDPGENGTSDAKYENVISLPNEFSSHDGLERFYNGNWANVQQVPPR